MSEATSSPEAAPEQAPTQTPAQAPKTEQRSGVMLRWLWSNYLHRHWKMLILAVIFMSIEGSTLGFLSLMMQPMFDQVFLAGDSDAIWWVGLVIMGIFIVRALSSMAQKVILTRISQQSEADIRAAFTQSMGPAPSCSA
jgi:subfamily B ATP-binding cassette protein MsbA